MQQTAINAAGLMSWRARGGATGAVDMAGTKKQKTKKRNAAKISDCAQHGFF
jgi:hypothetical protein